VPTVLEEIIAAHRTMHEADRRNRSELERALSAAPPPRDFAAAIAAGGRASGAIGVIAEVKRRSPSKGDLAPDLDPAALVRQYERGGATCVSVLTDERYFGGNAADVVSARRSSTLPILRKDFTVAAADLYDARVMGADAVLLIVAALEDPELVQLIALAGELGLAALVEVHDEQECRRALRAGARLVGVNQRDLHTFEVDPHRAQRLAALLPGEVLRVAESGVRTPNDVRELREAGYDAVLIGERLVAAPDATAALRELLGGVASEVAG
jgi:indole-3-glycerol phosphate synthase